MVAAVAAADGEHVDAAIMELPRHLVDGLDARRDPHPAAGSHGFRHAALAHARAVAIPAGVRVDDDADAGHGQAAGRAAASWPQAAWMSPPRLSRIVAAMPCSRRIAWKRSTRTRGLGAKPASGKGLNGMRFTLARSPWSRRTSARVAVGVVLGV